MREAEYVMQQPTESDRLLALARQKRPVAGQAATPGRHTAEVGRLYRTGVSKAEIGRRLDVVRTWTRGILEAN